MRRLLPIVLLLTSCGPMSQQVAKDWAACAGLKAAAALGPMVAEALRADDWREQLTALAAGTLPGLVDCSIAAILRASAIPARAGGPPSIAPATDPDREFRRRGMEWLRSRGWKSL